MVSQAWDEAVALLSLVGIESDDININNPGLGSQGSGEAIPNAGGGSDGEHDHLDESDRGIKDGHEGESNAAQLQRLIGVQETEDWRTVDGPLQEKMHVLTCAAMALDLNDMDVL